MAKVPLAGAVKTRLCPPPAPSAAAVLARCVLLDRIDQVRDVRPAWSWPWPRARRVALRALVPPGIPLVPQSGANLGARMDHVLTAPPAAGYAGAVAVGTDTPTLPTSCLRRACVELRGGADVVLGRAEDGGQYLIA